MSGPCADCGGPDYQTLVARIAELEAELSAPWRVGAFIEVDGLTVGPHMVRSYRECIAELEAALAFVKDWLDDMEPVELLRCEMRWAEKKVEL